MENRKTPAGRIRIGQAVDIHQLREDRPLVLGGVHIPAQKGLYGHSDADVLVHAIAESLLGALALGDLGHWFPDTDPKWKGADSLLILGQVRELVKEHGYAVGNIDAEVLAERPKLAPYIEEMRANVARVLETDIESVSIKATRGEKMGFVGREEGMAAFAVCLVERV